MDKTPPNRMSAYRCLWYLFALLRKSMHWCVAFSRQPYIHSWYLMIDLPLSIPSDPFTTALHLSLPQVPHGAWRGTWSLWLEAHWWEIPGGSPPTCARGSSGIWKALSRICSCIFPLPFKSTTVHPFLATTATRFTCAHHGLPAPLHFKYRTHFVRLQDEGWRISQIWKVLGTGSAAH